MPQPREDWKPGQDPKNVVQAIKKAKHDLADSRLPPAERAIALCWYLHLVGDLHQPLHAVALATEELPDGDRGGNLIRVTHNGSETNLHSFWDQRLGGYQSGATINRVIERAVNDNPRESLGAEAQPAERRRVAGASKAVGLQGRCRNPRQLGRAAARL